MSSTQVDPAGSAPPLAGAPQVFRPPARGVWIRGVWSAKFGVGAVLLLAFVAVGLFGPMLYTRDPSAVGLDVLASPSRAHLMGTTQTGQDVLAQLIVGTRGVLIVGFAAGILATVLSVIVGLLSGYLPGVTDESLSVLTNVFLVIPALPLVIVLAAYLPRNGWLSLTLVLTVTSWAWGARVIRAQTLSLRKRDFVEAARATGEGSRHIVFREIMPNEIALIAAQFLFTVIFAVLTMAGLTFLGLGDSSQWTWGSMLFWAQNAGALTLGAWWWFVPPGLCIALLGTSLALMNFAIDEYANPRLRQARAAADDELPVLLQAP